MQSCKQDNSKSVKARVLIFNILVLAEKHMTCLTFG